MKLTKTQQSILDEMKETIATFKKYDTFNEYFEKEVRANACEDWVFPDHTIEMYKELYTNGKNNIVIKKANTKTFEKLVALGLIEVIEYRESQIDLVRVLN